MELPKGYVFTIFGVVSITGPVFGVIFGGLISSKLGGYNSPSSLYVTTLLGLLSVVFAIPIPFIPKDLVPLQIVLLWCLLFAGGFTMPSVTGVMLNTVPEHLKTTANSLSNTCYNIFGFLPSPYIYGAIADRSGKREAMFANMCVSFMAAAPIMYQAFQVYMKERR
jgi:MFS family permease